MKRVALLGYPLGHSVSPAMQNAALRARGLDWRYEAWEEPPEALAEAVARLREPDWAGANVTVPHKQAVLPLLDEVEERARAVGAVNTLVNRSGRLWGTNTDVEGFAADLARLGVAVAGRPVWLLGAGGAARAVAAALAAQGAWVSVLCRRLERGQALVRDLGLDAAVLPWEAASFAAAPPGALVVNATPLGMAPQAAACPWPEGVPLPEGAFVYDLVYNPRPTRLVARARAAGLGAADGLGMLVEQGARAFELWTGLDAPREVMWEAAEAALEVSHAALSDGR